MRKRQKVIAGLSVGAAALFLLIVLCARGKGRGPEPQTRAEADDAPEPEVQLSFDVEERRQSLAEAIEPGPPPQERLAAAEEVGFPPLPAAVAEGVEPVLVEAPPEAPPPREPACYTVKPGDTYFSIAKEVYGATKYFLDIELANGIEAHRLRAGQKIALPRVQGVELNLPKEEPRRHEAQVEEYTIEQGDTLGQIAVKLYGTSKVWKKLVEANPGLEPKRLIPGTRIAVPPLVKDEQAPR